jgi:deazaflavin-dependent oxidoreductase (nitroreductase family)
MARDRRSPRYDAAMDAHPLWLRSFWKVHRLLDRLSGGRLGSKVFGIPSLWLTTVGRTSGTVRSNGLYYLADGADLVIVASNAGLDSDPGWFLNLMANPDTTVRIGRTIRDVHARLADPVERARFWPRLVRLDPDFATYQARSAREIPVVILEPRQPAGTGVPV